MGVPVKGQQVDGCACNADQVSRCLDGTSCGSASRGNSKIQQFSRSAGQQVAGWGALWVGK
jgi:hypothetical protein